MSVSVCNIRRFLRIARVVRGRFPQTRDLWKLESMDCHVGRVSSHAVSSWTRSPGGCGFRGVFWVGRGVFACFFSIFFFFERSQPAASMRPSSLIYLSSGILKRGGCYTACTSLLHDYNTYVIHIACRIITTWYAHYLWYI